MTLSCFLSVVVERVTDCCGWPLASVVWVVEPVTCAVALRLEMMRPATARVASEVALVVGKKERLFIRCRPYSASRTGCGGCHLFYPAGLYRVWTDRNGIVPGGFSLV